MSSSFQKYISDPSLTICPVISNEEATAINLNYSLLLFHAVWSGYSITNIQRVLSILHMHHSKELKIYLIDIDTIEHPIIINLLGQLSHGYGEAIIYKNSVVLSKHTNKGNLPEFLNVLTTL